MNAFERRCSERATLLETAARTFAAVASRHADVIAVYAFGSIGERRVGPRSDLDLLVVRETSIRGPMRGEDLAALGVELDPQLASHARSLDLYYLAARYPDAVGDSDPGDAVPLEDARRALERKRCAPHVRASACRRRKPGHGIARVPCTRGP